jgi:hypothetical protein
LLGVAAGVLTTGAAFAGNPAHDPYQPATNGVLQLGSGAPDLNPANADADHDGAMGLNREMGRSNEVLELGPPASSYAHSGAGSPATD